MSKLNQKIQSGVLTILLGDKHPWRNQTPPKPEANGKHRLLSRNRASHQSGGRMNIMRINRDSALFLADLFHIVIDVDAWRLLTFFWFIYFVTFAFFAVIYWYASDRCGIGCSTYVDSLFLSIETMMTIGYGVPDPYFRPCPWLVIALLLQCLLAILYDACLIGIVYQRISRGTTRASTIIFSDKALIQSVNGAHYLTFRICEMRRTQLLECHIRCYTFKRSKMFKELKAAPATNVTMDTGPRSSKRLRASASTDSSPSSVSRKTSIDAKTPMACFPMRLERPDDSLGAMMLLVLPSLVVHRMDAWSPMRGDVGSRQMVGGNPWDEMSWHTSSLKPPQRASESDVGSRDSVTCEVCGSTYQRPEQLLKHVEYSASESGGGDQWHMELLSSGRLPAEPSASEVKREISRTLDTRDIEIVVILEGVDATTSSSVQARHSYTADDIVWDHDFTDCVSSDAEGVFIDFSLFHDIVPLEETPDASWPWERPTTDGARTSIN